MVPKVIAVPSAVPWEQWGGESDRHYQMFLVYLGLDYQSRTISGALKAKTDDMPSGYKVWHDMFHKFRWAERVHEKDIADGKIVRPITDLIVVPEKNIEILPKEEDVPPPAPVKPPTRNISPESRARSLAAIEATRGHVRNMSHRDKVNELGKELTHEPIWERQPGEKPQHFRMFLAFASLENGSNRNIKRAWQKWSGKETATGGQFATVAATWRWMDRAAAWDAFKLEQQQQKWLIRDGDRRENDYNAGGKLRDRALAVLDDMDDQDLKDPFVVAKMIQLGSDLQQKAIPNVQLQSDQIQQVISALPLERREIVLKMLVAEIKPA
jgi:hypothetical protein